MNKTYDINVSYQPVNHQKTWTYPNDYKYPIYCDEKKLGGRYIHVYIISGELVCVYEGSREEPPFFEPDWQELIIVQPKLKYWGKGITQ